MKIMTVFSPAVFNVAKRVTAGNRVKTITFTTSLKLSESANFIGILIKFKSPNQVAYIRPVSNVVLLPCRTQMNLAWQWHEDGTAAVANFEPNTVAPNSKDKTNHPSSVIVCK